MCQHILILVKFNFSFLQCMYVITIFQEIDFYSWLKSNYLVLAMHALHLFSKQVTGLFSSLIPGTHVRLLALKRLIYALVGSRSINYWVRYLSIIEVGRVLSIEVTWWGWFCLKQSIRKWGIVSMFTMNFYHHKFLNVIGIVFGMYEIFAGCTCFCNQFILLLSKILTFIWIISLKVICLYSDTRLVWTDAEFS